MTHPVNPFWLTEKCLGEVAHFEDTQPWIYQLDNPYLHGVYAPTRRELEADELEVIGELPDDLCGAYFRNGPNPAHEPANKYHPFDGDGMVHAVYFRDGKASYRNRYIQTAALAREALAGEAIWPGVMGPFDFSLADFPIKDTSNTDIMLYNGALLSTWYNAGHPYNLDPLNLATLQNFSLKGRESRRLSAHAKIDHQNGELLFFDYGDDAPYLSYGVASATGKLLHEVPIELSGPRLPHDMGFTRNYAILHDLPLFQDPEVLQRHGYRVLTFHRDLPARFGVLPRRGESSDVRWFDCEPCYILHVSNCWEEGEWLVMDGCRSINPIQTAVDGEGELAHMLAYMRLEANAYRWRFNLRTGEVREGDIDKLNTEFNKTNPLYHGVKSRYAYHQRIPLLTEGGHTLRFTGLVKYDNDSGLAQQWDYGENVYGSEAPFAPRAGATASSVEDDGYVITLVTDANNWQSECLVFDAKDVPQGPIARVRLPHRVPAGFHASWARGEDLYRDC